MKALFELFRRFDARRIFGFIRRLGGHVTSKSQVLRFAFYPRPPGGGRHQGISQKSNRVSDFYPRLPDGGRRAYVLSARKFNSISIHALRVEGDADTTSGVSLPSVFLSTPSGWRAIPLFSVEDRLRMHFYPRPLGGGRRPQGCNTDYRLYFYPRPPGGGRPAAPGMGSGLHRYFYPRPPGGGRRSHQCLLRL